MALFSINAHQHELAQAFVRRGRCGIYLGDIRRGSLNEFNKKIVRLMDDHHSRKEFSRRGRGLIDGRARERIAKVIRAMK